MELRGFKSFADKTILTFDEGITAIVGPNGSGKSNISDAVRWVMGEQNVRQLRGLKSEDIIFSGTEKRRPQGAAEVSLYFDNQDHSLDVDFTEVVVTRRYFRSGESEFYINKRPCRLKDIHLLFADTGIGQDSMAVIGQNRVDRILNSKPEERRVIFEEVAGISRYKGRKEEGLRKIAETDRNLERIHDMMAVLEEQLGPMEMQAQRLQEFRGLDGERIAYEGTLTLQELRNSERLLTKAENTRVTAQEQLEDTSKQLSEAEGKRQQLMAVMEKEGETLRRLDEEAMAVHNELDSMKSRRDAFSQRLVELKEEESQVAEEAQGLSSKYDDIGRQRTALENQLSARRTELDAARNGLALSEDMYNQSEQEAARQGQALEAVTKANSKREQELLLVRRDIDELQRRISEIDKRRHDLANLLEQEEQKASERNNQVEQLKQRQAEAVAAAASAEERAKQALQEQKKADTAFQQCQHEWQSRRSKGDGMAQRIRVLEGMEREHEGASRAAREILKAQSPWRSGIRGMVAELCTIPQVYVGAVDAALGGAAQFIIADDEKTSRAAIAYLKERHAGRTTFLPLDTIQVRNRTDDENRAAREKGIAGFASDLIQYDPIYRPAFMNLLGRTLIAESQDAGAAVARKYHYRLRIVCLDGTQFNSGGSLTGGSQKSREGSLISRKALLEELRQSQAENDERLTGLERQRAALEKSAQSLSEEARALDDTRQQAQLDLQKASWQAESAEHEAAQLQSSSAKMKEQMAGLDQAQQSLTEQLSQKVTLKDSWQTQPETDTRELETARKKALDELEQCRQAVTEQKITVATLQEQLSHLAEQLQQNEALKEQADADGQRLAQRRAATLQRQQEAQELVETLGANITTKSQEAAEKDKAKDDFYQQRTDNFQQSQRMDEALKELRERLDDWNRRINASDIQLEKYRGEIQRSEERLALQGLTRQEAMERRREGTLKELTEKVGELRQRISELGQINPNADEEYRAAVEKQAFFTKQCDDLLEARTKLEAVVAEIDTAMASQFDAAFKEISVHFQQIFSRLFGGGSAQIILTNKQDILGSGVEFYIQPPGKKQQQLNLLSGGERALTVIALLFSFLAYHPAPFCLVDEVDAALDEANVERFGRYLKNYSGNTQFIVITHRRKTMEAASTLQGVTMEEKGVSRLLTVKVDELLKEGT